MRQNTASDDERQARFEKRFAASFGRVHAYVSRRTAGRAAAERLTREILVSALRELLEDDEDDLAVVLLRTAHQLLHSPAVRAREEDAATEARAPARWRVGADTGA